MNKEKTKTITADILEECIKVHSERHIQYGPSELNFSDIAKIATRLSLSDNKFTALDIATVMVAVKEVRYKYQYKRLQEWMEEEDDDNDETLSYSKKVLHDSVVDWINYIAIMENVRILTQRSPQYKDVQIHAKNA